MSSLHSYRAVVLGYGALGALLGVLFTRLSVTVEAVSSEDQSCGTEEIRKRFGLHRSKGALTLMT